MNFDIARKIADAVLYEGYVLYPYRASSAKNRFRWQFGVLAPRAYGENAGEPWMMETQCLVETHGAPAVDIVVRFLQVQARTVEAPRGNPVESIEIDGRRFTSWEEGVERQVELRGIPIARLFEDELIEPFSWPRWREEESLGGAGVVVRERWALSGRVALAAERRGGIVKLRVRVENLTPLAGADRQAAIRRSLNGAHTLLGITDGAFLSLTDPPPAAIEAAAGCRNLHTWPVLAGRPGERDILLSSPIILSDYPAVAPESPGDLFDATEIDELLTLRVMTLTEDEKREARATDPRASAIVDRSDSLPREEFERLHGVARCFGPFVTGGRVRLRPRRRADSMDMFLAGRIARVAAIERDFEDRTYIAVSLEDDPGTGLYNRYFYFDPEELEPVEEPKEDN